MTFRQPTNQSANQSVKMNLYGVVFFIYISLYFFDDGVRK